jgi:anti-sigma B factor antagonist
MRNFLTSYIAEEPARTRRKGSIVQLLSIEQGRSIRLAGELDMSTAAQLDEVLGTAVEHGGAITIDLSELTFMDSTGIGVFLRAAVSLRGRGCLILHGEQDRVRRVLDLVRVDGSIPNLHRVPHDASLDSHNGSDPERSKVS